MKKFLSLVLALVMTFSLVTIGAGAEDFTDAEDITYVEAVEVLTAIGVVDGDTAGNFNPTNGLTRGAAAKIICNMILGPTTAAELNADTDPFVDVDKDSVFAGYIAYCVKEGIVSGYANGTFQPAAPLTGYAFMKMLLGALGYDPAVEGYTGANWSINVAKQAISIGLNAGLVDSFNGSDYVTREEAMLYAFNTLQATMVEYDQKTVVSVAGAEVALSGNIKEVSWGTARMNDGNIDPDGYVQFAEKYFSKLDKNATLDDFGRPAHTWTNNKKEIGTYVDYTLLVAEYTTAVKGNEIYNVLGATAIDRADLYVYEDGVETGAIAKNELAKNYKVTLANTGNGVLTQVFYDEDWDEIFIVEINTYLAKATADYHEKTDKTNLTVYGYDKVNKVKDSDYATGSTAAYAAVKGEDFEALVDCVADDFFLVTIADGDLYSVETVEAESDIAMTTFVKDKKVANASDEYVFADALYYNPAILYGWDISNMADTTYNVYLDSYGYLLGIEEYKAADNYVFITGYDYTNSSIAAATVKANAIFVDGTMATISVNVEKSDGTWTTPGGNAAVNKWFTYSVNSADVYTLKNTTKQAHDTANDIKSAYVGLNNTATTSRYYYGNNATNYIVIDETDGLKELNSKTAIYKVDSVISGVKNVNITVAKTDDESYGSYVLFNNDGYIVAAVVVGTNNGLSANYAYVVTGNPIQETITTDSEGYWYWDFQVITKNEGLTTKTVKAEAGELTSIIASGAEGLYKLTYDADGYIVGTNTVDTVDMTSPAQINTLAKTTMRWTTTAALATDGETLNNTANSNMRGFALAAGYEIYTVETINGTITATDYAGDAIAAVNSLALNETASQKEVYALFNAVGEAEVIIIDIDDNYVTNAQGNYNGNAVTNVTSIRVVKGADNGANAGLLCVKMNGATAGDVLSVDVTMYTNGVPVEMGGYTGSVNVNGYIVLPISVAVGANYTVTHHTGNNVLYGSYTGA